MTHAHITAWAVALILFVVVLLLQNANKAKGVKITQMVLRLFYVLIVVTGAQLLHVVGTYINGTYIVKSILGILVIGAMEMVLVRRGKGKPTRVPWILFAITLVVVIYLGFYLPYGNKLW
ncbi:MAG: YisL family protein [Bacillaceae bacterium]|nr:YisL family protein [Bacillaceae bacterium]